jgi:hypothetical protein
MWEDPIVADTRELRDEMMSEAGASIDDLFAYLQRDQEAYRNRLVRFPARKAIPVAGTQRHSAG